MDSLLSVRPLFWLSNFYKKYQISEYQYLKSFLNKGVLKMS